MEGRLLAVVDAFDAMTSQRPYRPALTIGAALAEIERCAGTQFDPEIAQVFLAAYDAGEIEEPLPLGGDRLNLEGRPDLELGPTAGSPRR